MDPTGAGGTGKAPPVTLLIPTVHHRAALYARTLRYLEDSGYRGPIVVSDHSPPAEAGVIAAVSDRQRGLDLKLLRHDPQQHFLLRLADCAKAAQTPYVHLHADDDFLVLPVLARLAAELERIPGCVAAMGLNLHLWPETRQLSVLPKTPNLHASPFERLIAQLESYSSVLYALRRREEMIGCFTVAVQHCPDVQFWQYLESCLAAIRGAVAVIDDLHYLRGVHAQKWSSTLVEQRSRDHFPYLALSPEFHARVAAFRAALVAACEASSVPVSYERLDAALLHLLSRGLRMGLPQRQSAPPAAAPDAGLRALQAKLADPASAEAAEMDRIFAAAGAPA
jgi:glycosyltransferase domain-containing protein